MVADAERRVTNTGLEDIIGTSGTGTVNNENLYIVIRMQFSFSHVLDVHLFGSMQMDGMMSGCHNSQFQHDIWKHYHLMNAISLSNLFTIIQLIESVALKHLYNARSKSMS